MVTNTCSAGRGLGKVSAAVTRGRRLLRCLVHLDCLDWNLLSHGTTWGERGAHEPAAPQGYRHSGACESPPVLVWMHTSPQHHSVLHWERLHTEAVCGRNQRPKPALSWHMGQEGVNWPTKFQEGRKGHNNSFCPTLSRGSGTSRILLTIPGSTKTQNRCWEERAQPFLPSEEPALQRSPCCTKWKHKSPSALTSWALLPSHSGAQLHPPQGIQGAVLTPLVNLKTLQCPTEGLETIWSQGVHPRAAGCTVVPDHSPQSTSDPEETQLGTERSPKAEVLPPEGRARDARDWTACSDWAFPHTSHPRDIHHLFSYLLQITREILNGSLLSVQTPRNPKHSKKA